MTIKKDVSARSTALAALCRVQKGGYSNLTLDDFLSRSGLDNRDRDFAARLFYGVLERLTTLDYVLALYASRPLSQTPPPVCNAMRMGLYELLYMRTEPFAAVSEAVALVQRARQPKASGFVNAVLRQFLRDGGEIRYPDRQRDEIGYLSIYYACPRWLVKSLVEDYGADAAEACLGAQLGKPPLTVRVNTTRVSPQELTQRLEREGLTVSSHPLPGCLRIENGNPAQTAAFADGLLHVQDAASQLCSLAAAAFAPKTVADVCAAPGGKSFTIAELTGAQLFSCDLHPNRVRLIEQGAKRLGLSAVRTCVRDARTPYHGELFDLVLCDAPCSGFGVIRRKPEIKQKPEASVAGLPQVQLDILRRAAGLVRPGGVLLYTTCTLRRAENEQVADRFIKQADLFSPQPLPEIVRKFYPSAGSRVTLLPGALDCDGFFIAAFRKGAAE